MLKISNILLFFVFVFILFILSTTSYSLFSSDIYYKGNKEVSLGLNKNALISNEKLPKILVGPNILVSRDGDFPHVELMVAISPKNQKNLLGGAITFNRRDGGNACKAYVSSDGGYVWSDIDFAEQKEFGGADPQVAFGLDGTAYFTALTWIKDEAGHSHTALYFYPSKDQGRTWQTPTNLGNGYDHEQIVVDHTYGRYAGRIYIGALYGNYPEYVVGVFRSDNNGQTFVGPVDAANARNIGPGMGINVATNMLVLSDGTLFVPYSDFSIDPKNAKQANNSTFSFVTSLDGGVTFSPSIKIHDQYGIDLKEWMKAWKRGSFVRGTFPVFSSDTQSNEYRDRLYVIWNDWRFGNSRILFSLSKDKGKTWTPPKLIDPDIPRESQQYQPMMFVNNQGTVGLMWFDTKESNDESFYNLYFTASTNGGESFLPPAKVSSEPSVPLNAANLKPALCGIDKTEKIISLSLWSGFSWHAHGGDYMGLTADAKGVFHPFWADSRSGLFQIWTSQIMVTKDSQDAATKEKIQDSKTRAILNDRLEIVIDPTSYDLKKQEMQVPIRLRNVCKDNLYGPFTVEVKNLIKPSEIEYYGKELIEPPQILNATNNKSGVGAIFDYSSSLRDFEFLEPGALTEAVKWTIRLPNFTFLQPLMLSMDIELSGFVSGKKENIER